MERMDFGFYYDPQSDNFVECNTRGKRIVA